jgi:hypothetical protein
MKLIFSLDPISTTCAFVLHRGSTSTQQSTCTDFQLKKFTAIQA